MTKHAMKRGGFAVMTAVALAFGAAQAFAAPGTAEAKARWCEPAACQRECGPGCGGTCVGVECWCDC